MKKWALIILLGVSTSSIAWPNHEGDEFCKTLTNTNMKQLQKQGIEQVDRKSQYQVAELFEHGCGVKKDLYQAYAWYATAGMYENGFGKADEIFDALKDKRLALDAYDDLKKQMKPYYDKISKQRKKAKEHAYLDLINGDKAHNHPAAVVRDFNKSFDEVQRGE